MITPLGKYVLSSKGDNLGEQNDILDAPVSKRVSQQNKWKNHPMVLTVSKKWERSMTPPVQRPIWLAISYSLSKNKFLTN